MDLAMFTAAGARVRTLAAGLWPAGSHIVNWNGQDERGGRLPAGLYFVRLRAGGRSEVSRFVMIR
jgi:flagellar hook assembly protein FlgD